MVTALDVADARSLAVTPGVARPANIRALTSIRFLAALHVALYHMVRPFSLWGPLAAVMSAGYVGVSFFFVLSGFILTYSHAAEYEAGRASARRFWMARFARVYPAYLLCLLLAAYVDRGRFHRPLHRLTYGLDLLMLQSWSEKTATVFNVPAWSLSVEAFFYLVFPFLVLRLRPGSQRQGVLAIAGFTLLALAAPLLCVALYPALFQHEGTVGPPLYWIYQVRRMPLLALPEFLAGVSLGWLYVRYGVSARWGGVMAGAGAVLLAVALASSEQIPFLLLHNGLLLPVFALLILGLCRPSWMTRVLSLPALVLLGEASYALYLTHFLFNTWVMDRFGAPSTIAAALWKLAVLLPVSVGVFLYVERPCRRLILGWYRARHPAELQMAGGEGSRVAL